MLPPDINPELSNLRQLARKTYGSLGTTHDAVAHLVAVRAQNYDCAFQAIELHTDQTKEQMIAAIENLEIIRTWLQPGAMYFVSPEDAFWLVKLSAKRYIAGTKRRHECLGLDERTLGRAKELFARELEGGKRATRHDLRKLLTMNRISIWGERGHQMLWYAVQTGLIYIGPREGKQPTFGLLADLPVKPKDLSREEALTELARRYFVGHGPATIQDFVQWSCLPVHEVKVGLSGASAALHSTKIDGLVYWFDAKLSSGITAPG